MPIGKPGEVWLADLGMQAKVRPCLVLTQPPRNDELAVVTLVAHTTSVRGNRWELSIPKHFLQAGAFDVQRIATVATVKLERKLGELNSQEFSLVLDKLAERLGIRAGSICCIPTRFLLLFRILNAQNNSRIGCVP